MLANKIYMVEASILFKNATAGYTTFLSVTTPASPTAITLFHQVAKGLGPTTDVENWAVTQTSSGGAGGSTQSDSVSRNWITGYVSNGANAGNLTVQFKTNDGSKTAIVCAGSWMRITLTD
jgi:hypothetical protein